MISPAGRALLDDLKRELALPQPAAEAIEAEVLQPFRDYAEKLSRYQQALEALAAVLPATRRAAVPRGSRGTRPARETLQAAALGCGGAASAAGDSLSVSRRAAIDHALMRIRRRHRAAKLRATGGPLRWRR